MAAVKPRRQDSYLSIFAVIMQALSPSSRRANRCRLLSSCGTAHVWPRPPVD